MNKSPTKIALGGEIADVETPQGAGDVRNVERPMMYEIAQNRINVKSRVLGFKKQWHGPGCLRGGPS